MKNEVIDIVGRGGNLYNDNFWSIILLAIFLLACMALNLYFNKNSIEDYRLEYFVYVLKKKFTEMIVFLLIDLFLILFLTKIFYINITGLFYIFGCEKIVLGVWIIVNIFSGRRLYKELYFNDFLRKVRRGKYNYMSSKNIMLDIFDRCDANYTLQAERLGILKSLAPISLIPLFGGYILEGKDIIINWNWYTMTFFAVLFIYFYNLWMCYKNMKLWKAQLLKVQSELRNLQYEKSESQE